MKKVTMLLLCLVFAGVGTLWAQNAQISGVITDAADGQPLPGVSVVVKGAGVSTATDANGRYTINAAGDATLVFSYVGLKTQEQAVAGRATINVALESGTVALSEVVVTAMGIRRPERSLGNAKTVVNPDDAIQRAEPDLFRSLNGKIPGVNVMASSAVAGSATKVTIRGNSSFYGSNDPLYVVDGIPYSNPEVTTGNRLTTAGAYGTGLSTLDPNDIESMNVLKGAAAAALYGSRAANGVILITTKSGSKKTGSKP